MLNKQEMEQYNVAISLEKNSKFESNGMEFDIVKNPVLLAVNELNGDDGSCPV